MATNVMRGVMKVRSGRTVHAHTVGADSPRADGAAVVLVHAGGSMSVQWKGVLEAFGGRWDAAAIDLHGIALTTPWQATGETRELEVDDEAQLVLDFCDAAYPGRMVHLVGHSYGASVALRAALIRPSRVASLTMYEVQSPALNSRLGPASASAQWVHGAIDKFLAAMELGDVEQAMEGWTDAIVFPGFWRRQNTITRQRLSTVASPGVLQMQASKRDRTTLDDLVALAVPLVLMVGGASPLHFREPTETIMRVRKHRAAWRVIPGATHLGPQTHAAQLVAALEACWPELVLPERLRATG